MCCKDFQVIWDGYHHEHITSVQISAGLFLCGFVIRKSLKCCVLQTGEKILINKVFFILIFFLLSPHLWPLRPARLCVLCLTSSASFGGRKTLKRSVNDDKGEDKPHEDNSMKSSPVSLTLHVFPRDELEGLIEKHDGQGELQHRDPLF